MKKPARIESGPHRFDVIGVQIRLVDVDRSDGVDGIVVHGELAVALGYV
jgi:hypothetical protein